MAAGPGTKPGPVLPVFWTGSFLKNTFLDRQKCLRRNFDLDILGVITTYFPNHLSSRTLHKGKLPFLTQKAVKCSWYKDLK